MKQKKRFLLPLILLLTMLMTCSALAKPRLSANTVTISPIGRVSYNQYEHLMEITYKPAGSLYLLGVNRDTVAYHYDYLSLREHYVGVSCGRYKSGKLPLYATWYCDWQDFTIYSGISGDSTVLKVDPYEPNTTGKIKILARKANDSDKPFYSTTLNVRIRNDLAKTISYLKIGNKKFTAPFRSSKSRSIIDLKGVPTGKKVKVTFKTTGKLKKAKYFYLLRTKKAYKNGSKVTLRKGDVLMIGGKLDKKGYATVSVPIVINVDHTQYKQN